MDPFRVEHVGVRYIVLFVDDIEVRVRPDGKIATFILIQKPTKDG